MIALALHVDVHPQAEAIYDAAHFRCCSLEEFAGWWEQAQQVNPPHERIHPGSARQFCNDCLPMVRQWMAEQGRCVRLNGPKVADRLKESA